VKPATVDLGRLRELHAAGLSDRKIAQELVCDDRNVGYHRRRLGLPANFPRKSGGFKSCGERLPDHLRPRLRLLLLALKRVRGGYAWVECWRYFRRLEGRPEANLVLPEGPRGGGGSVGRKI